MTDGARPGPADSPTAVRTVLSAIGVSPNRSLGQNFLIDRNVRDCVVAASVPEPCEGILEIGPGLGMLTESLVERTGHLIAIEKDRRLAEWLGTRFLGDSRVEILCEDAMQADLSAVLPRVRALVSNLPYSTGSRILARAIQDPARPARMAVTVQLEVAQRLAATPGGGDYGLLSVWAQNDYRVAIERKITPRCFWPVPEVTSALVLFEALPRRGAESGGPGERAARETFYAVTKLAFQHRRKRLTGALAAGGRGGEDISEAIRQAGIDGNERPEAIPPEAWWRLAVALTTVRGAAI